MSRARRKPWNEYSRSEINHFIQLYLKGDSINGVTKKFNLPDGALRGEIVSRGLPLRRKFPKERGWVFTPRGIPYKIERVQVLAAHAHRGLDGVMRLFDVKESSATRILDYYNIERRRHKKFRMTEARVNRMIKEYKKGATLFQLQKKYHHGLETVKREFRKRGIRIRYAVIEHELGPRGLEKFVKVYNSGKYTGHEIAKMFGMSQPTVKRLRRRLKLPERYADDHPRNIDIRTKTIELHQEGLNDSEIAKIAGTSAETIRKRRIQLGLPAMSKGGLTEKQVHEQIRTVRDLALQGKTTPQIQRITGWGRRLVNHRLIQADVLKGSPNREPFTKAEDTIILKSFQKGESVAQISRMLGRGSMSAKYRLLKVLYPKEMFLLRYRLGPHGEWEDMGWTRKLKVLRDGIKVVKKDHPDAEINILPFPPLPIEEVIRTRSKQTFPQLPVDKQTYDKFRAEYNKGTPVSVLKKKFGLQTAPVVRIINRIEGSRPLPGGDLIRDKVNQLNKEGLTNTEIAQRLKLKHSWVRQVRQTGRVRRPLHRRRIQER